MSKFFKSGDEWRVSAANALDIHDNLPVGNYIIKNHPLNGLYLIQQDPFPEMKKLYGDTIKHAERILSTFDRRGKSTGVLLSGEKGSGKTLLAKQLSILGASFFQMPTIIIDSSFHGSDFNKFIQDIDQPAIILFDEFEKLYDEEEQSDILTLLDGVYPSQKLFVLTVNDEYAVSDFLFNRPGRIYYAIEFEGLDSKFIKEYCEDVLIRKDYIENICSLASLFSAFNFDMLQALVEEMNRYGESPIDAIKLLNVKPRRSSGNDIRYSITLMDQKGKVIIPEEKGKTWYGIPLKESLEVYYKFPSPNGEDDVPTCSSDYEHEFHPKHIVKFNAVAGDYEYINDAGLGLILKRKEEDFNYTRFLV